MRRGRAEATGPESAVMNSSHMSGRRAHASLPLQEAAPVSACVAGATSASSRLPAGKMLCVTTEWLVGGRVYVFSLLNLGLAPSVSVSLNKLPDRWSTRSVLCSYYPRVDFAVVWTCLAFL